MTLTSKQLGSIALVIVLGVAGMMLANAPATASFAGPIAILVALVGYAGSVPRSN